VKLLVDGRLLRSIRLTRSFKVLLYPSGMSVSTRALSTLSDVLRRRRRERATRWRRLSAGRQALLVIAYLRKGETYADLACGFRVGTSTVYRYVREALELLAAMAPTLQQAIAVAAGKAFVILDGTLLRVDRVGMAGDYNRGFYSGKHKCHGLNVQVIADPIGRLVWISPVLRGAPRHGRRPRARHHRRTQRRRDHDDRRHGLPRRRSGDPGSAAAAARGSRHRPLPPPVA